MLIDAIKHSPIAGPKFEVRIFRRPPQPKLIAGRLAWVCLDQVQPDGVLNEGLDGLRQRPELSNGIVGEEHLAHKNIVAQLRYGKGRSIYPSWSI
jgi:hypothetical protein